MNKDDEFPKACLETKLNRHMVCQTRFLCRYPVCYAAALFIDLGLKYQLDIGSHK